MLRDRYADLVRRAGLLRREDSPPGQDPEEDVGGLIGRIARRAGIRLLESSRPSSRPGSSGGGEGRDRG